MKSDDIPAAFSDFTPKEIESRLRTSGCILGLNEALKAAALLVHNHFKGRGSGNLFAAPSRSGKTHLWRMLQKESNDNTIVIHDASSLTAEGWKGNNKISTIFKDIPAERRGHIILVLDEFDKLLEPQHGTNGTNYSDIVQNQLLKLCDHDTLFFGNERELGFSVDASGISVVLLGAFQRLMEKKSQSSGSIGFGRPPYSDCDYDNSTITVEDLIDYGMREELAGRITRIICMDPLSSDDLVSIGLNEVKNLEGATGLMLQIEYAKLAELAIEAKEKGLGARWLKSTIGNMLDELIYNDPHALGYKLGCRSSDEEEIQTDECME
ncbi:MAG: AAA family ATPase [Oscillospiraceae bacterium]|nr:AAA family ATPase [Oscillospiraceae bacterium]